MAATAAALLALVAAGGCGGSSPSTQSTPTTTAVTATPSTLAPSAFGPSVMRGQILNEQVGESSGLVASRSNPERLWTHNDSDTPPEIFCLERNGGSCGTWTVAGATNVDWEDIAAGPGPEPGRSYLFIGDIGDNVGGREDVVVYRVPEPDGPGDAPGDATGTTGTTSTAPATAIPLHYDDGAHDAESLLVHPTTGVIYVISKEAGGAAVYRAPADGGVLTRVADLGLGLFGLATGADISPDGRRVAITTFVGGFELTLDGDTTDFDAIWATRPVPITLPPRQQGESIAYRLDGDALFLTSEGYPSPLYELPV